LGIGKGSAYHFALLSGSEPRRPEFDPIGDVPGRLREAGHVIDCHMDIVPACIVIGQRSAVAVAEYAGEIRQP
jgi:hypothetical protein